MKKTIIQDGNKWAVQLESGHGSSPFTTEGIGSAVFTAVGHGKTQEEAEQVLQKFLQDMVVRLNQYLNA